MRPSTAKALRLRDPRLRPGTSLAAGSFAPSRGPPGSFAYWIVCPKATAKLPKIVAFTDWLLAEAADDVRRLERLRSKSYARRRPA